MRRAARSIATEVSDPAHVRGGYGTNMRLAALSLATLMPSLATSSASAALPTLADAFSASFQAAQWVVIAYLLAITTTIVAAGQLGDALGRRRLLLAGIALFAAASLLCAAAPTLALLIAARAAQGLGAAIMMALAITFVGDIVPRAQMGRAMGLLGTMSAIGTTLGPSLGGILIASSGWRAVFLVNLPLGAAALALMWRALPADGAAARPGRARQDSAGMALLLAALGAYGLAMTAGSGRFGLLNLGLLLAALVAAAGFVAAEARAASPLIRLDLLGNRVLRTGLAANAVASTVVMATLVVGPFYLSRALALDAATVGLVLSAGPLVAALVGAPAGRLVDRVGAGETGVAGLAAMAAGSFALCLMPRGAGIAGYVVPIVVVTGGYAMFQAANNTAIMADAQPGERGLVSGMLNLSRNLGLMTGASAMGTIFALGVGGDVVAAAPEAIAGGTRTTFAVASFLVVAALAAVAGRIRAAVRPAGAARP